MSIFRNIEINKNIDDIFQNFRIKRTFSNRTNSTRMNCSVVFSIKGMKPGRLKNGTYWLIIYFLQNVINYLVIVRFIKCYKKTAWSLLETIYDIIITHIAMYFTPFARLFKIHLLYKSFMYYRFLPWDFHTTYYFTVVFTRNYVLHIIHLCYS
jgi:hypothetical protein